MADVNIDELLGRMTLDEKRAQVVGLWVQVDPEGGVAPYQGQFMSGDGRPAVEERTVHGVGQLTRPFGSRPVAAPDAMASIAQVQRRLLEETRLAIQAMVHEECLTGFMALGATSFPCPLNWGSSWDTDLVRSMGDAIRESMRAVGVHQGLAPVLDVVRDARWGRVEECIAEDPYLVGVVGCAYIEGLQGDDHRTGIVATAKHFAAHSASEGGRNLAPAHVGPRELADVFLVPFEMAVKLAKVRSIMNAYQDNDGVPVASSPELLTDLLRGQWGFDGIVVADYFSVAFLRAKHGVAHDRADAARQAIHAGIDVELPDPSCYPKLDEGPDLDRAVRRVLRMKEQLGLFDEPVVEPADVDLDPPHHRALARTLAERSIVLLANRDDFLPLTPDRTGRVAVIGPAASSRSALLGNYTFPVHLGARFPEALEAVELQSIEDGLRAVLPDATFAVVPGCDVVDTGDRSGLDEAVAAALGADVVVLVVGDQSGNFGSGTSGEGTDADDLSLPGLQDELARRVLATGTPALLVLVSGRPYAIGHLAEQAAAAIATWLPGEEGSAALAAIVTGQVNPSGKTSVSFSRGAGQQPRPYNPRLLGASDYARSSAAPVFPFGHGLSYTTFEYADLAVDETVAIDGTVRCSFTVRNTGAVAGDEVAQVYVRDIVASVTRPLLELKAFARIPLAPGASARVDVELPVDLLSFTGRDLRRIVEPGRHELLVGASSADIRLQAEFTVEGAEPRLTGEDRELLSRVSVTAA